MANYTPNYQLHQWEPQDPFLRTDFNQDLQKIDGALNGLAGDLAQKAAQSDLDEVRALATQSRFTKLKEIKFTNYSTSFEIDLSDLDWGQWDKIHLDCITSNGQPSTVYVNEVDGTRLFGLASTYSQPGIYHPRMTLYPAFQSSRFVSGSYGGGVNAFVLQNLTYGQIIKLVIQGGQMSPDNVFMIWGER